MPKTEKSETKKATAAKPKKFKMQLYRLPGKGKIPLKLIKEAVRKVRIWEAEQLKSEGTLS